MRKSTFALDHIARQFTDAGDGGGGAGPANEPGGSQEKSTDEPGGDDPEPGEEALGDPGKKALDTMKAKLKAERERANSAERQRDAAVQATELWNKRVIRAEVKAASKGRFADPADAFRFLDLEQFKVNDDGEPDEDAISAAIDTLLDDKPYLAAQREPEPWGSADQRPRGGNESSGLSAEEIVKKATSR